MCSLRGEWAKIVTLTTDQVNTIRVRTRTLIDGLGAVARRERPYCLMRSSALSVSMARGLVLGASVLIVQVRPPSKGQYGRPSARSRSWNRRTPNRTSKCREVGSNLKPGHPRIGCPADKHAPEPSTGIESAPRRFFGTTKKADTLSYSDGQAGAYLARAVRRC